MINLLNSFNAITKSKSRFRKNIISIATGSLASQIVLILAMPLLTRLYKPEEFGILALFTSAYAIFVGLITLKYDLSIILPQSKDKAVQLTVLTLVLSFLFSLIIFLLIVISYFAFNRPENGYFLLLPLSIFLGAAYTCGQQWSARATEYSRYAKSQVINSVVNVVVCVLLAVFVKNIMGSLVLGYIAGLIAGLFVIVNSFVKLKKTHGLYNLHFSKLIDIAIEYKRFPIFVLPSMLLISLGVNATPFVFQAIFSLTSLGHYSLANRFLVGPSGIISGAVGEAFRAEFVDRQRCGFEISGLYKHTLIKMLFVACPLFIIIFIFAPSLFSVLLGESYRDTGLLARYLCLGVFSQFISNPFLYVFVATNHVKLGLYIQSALTIIPLLCIILVGLNGNIESAVLTSSLLTFLISIALLFLAHHCCISNDSLIANRISDA